MVALLWFACNLKNIPPHGGVHLVCRNKHKTSTLKNRQTPKWIGLPTQQRRTTHFVLRGLFCCLFCAEEDLEERMGRLSALLGSRVGFVGFMAHNATQQKHWMLPTNILQG